MNHSHSDPLLHVRGVSALNRRASVYQRMGAACFDAGLVALASTIILSSFRNQRFPTLLWLLLGVAVWSAVVILPRLFLVKRSLGEILWQLMPGGSAVQRSLVGRVHWPVLRPMLRPQSIPSSTLFLAVCVTLAIWFSFAGVSQRLAGKNPAWMPAHRLRLSAFLPTGSDWTVVPFFYSMAAWPKRFAGDPISFELPYEKGPPLRFIGHIRMIWQRPEIRLTLEGPKTPTLKFSRTELKSCLVEPSISLRCLMIREESLTRHLNDSPAETMEMRWFSVENPALLPSQQPQGIFIRRSHTIDGQSVKQDRYILITENGAQQTLSLNYPDGETGSEAARMLEQIIRSMRVSEDLRPGLDWLGQSLAKVNLKVVRTREQLTEVQMMLLSKISIDPKAIDPFFHLAGVSRMMDKNPNSSSLDAAENAAGSKALVQNLIRYAQDIDPEHPRLDQLRVLAK